MDYYLHRGGQNVGIFSLEELRRRRVTDEVSGEDLVWREGMADWATLDSVLQTEATAAQPPPIPASAVKRTSNRRMAWILPLAIAGALAMGSLFVVNFVRGFRMAYRAQGGRTASSEEVDVTSKSIAVGSNTLTAEDVRKRSREFRLRQYVEAYKKNGDHNTPWDSEATQLMESWVAYNFGGATNLPSPAVLSDKLAALPDCNDPLVLTAAAANASEVHEKIRRLEKALLLFQESRYQAYPKFYVAVTLEDEAGNQPHRVRPLGTQADIYFQQALSDGSLQPVDEEEVAEILVHGWGSRFFKQHGTAVCYETEQAKRFPWLTLVLKGENEINEAWKARGGGYADTVKAEGWKGFSTHLANARADLTKAWKMHPERPLAPARMITVAMGDSDAEEMRSWFDRAIQAQIDYPQAWSLLRWGLRPRWLGSHEAMIALGVRAVETKRFDTDVPRKLFDCISDVESELKLEPGEHIYGRADIWPHLKDMYEGYLAEPKQAASWRDGWRSTYATVAFLAGKYDVAREQLEALNWKPVHDSLTGWGKDLSLMPLKVAALTGKSGGEVERAETAFAEHQPDTPLKIYSDLSAAAGTDERTRQFSRCRLAALKQEELLAKGEWIQLMPADNKDPNWELESNKIHCLPDGAVEVESDPYGHGFYSRTRVGPEFEVTGEFEVVRSSTKDFQGGLLIGLPDSQNSAWYAFRMKRNADEGDVASFSRGWTRQEVARKAALRPDKNSFQFRLQRGKADAWVNGTQVLRQAAPVKALALDTDCMLGLGAYNDMNETVIRYRNVKARRLVPGSRDKANP